jgi:hypothetical protein
VEYSCLSIQVRLQKAKLDIELIRKMIVKVSDSLTDFISVKYWSEELCQGQNKRYVKIIFLSASIINLIYCKFALSESTLYADVDRWIILKLILDGVVWIGFIWLRV